MAQAVSRQPIITTVRIRSQNGLCFIRGGTSSTGRGLSPSTSVFSSHNYSTNAPHSLRDTDAAGSWHS